MVKQVITVSPDGTMSGLQVKPGKGIDLRQFGTASIVRASEIAWSQDAQAWYVDVLQEAGKGPLTWDKWDQAGCVGFPAYTRDVSNRDDVFVFNNYDDAVAAEITYLDTLRAAGIH